MSNKGDRDKWDQRYLDAATPFSELIPSQVLIDYGHLLPGRGQALDLACGLGANALFLAQHGLEVSAWDISAVAINRLRQSARDQSLEIDVQVRDVVQQPPEEQRLDVLIVSRFLVRELMPVLIRALRPRGVLFYQTFIQEKSSDVGPGNPDYLLAENELLGLCDGMRVLAYREEGLVGDNKGQPQKGFRNEAMIVAQRRP